MKEKQTLKDAIIEAIAHYEKHAEREHKHALRFSPITQIHQDCVNGYHFNRGRAQGMKEALEYITEFIG